MKIQEVSKDFIQVPRHLTLKKTPQQRRKRVKQRRKRTEVPKSTAWGARRPRENGYSCARLSALFIVITFENYERHFFFMTF